MSSDIDTTPMGPSTSSTSGASTETAVLAGGCFWGMQDLFRKLPGVISSRVGYTGGENDNPTYRNHPGHAEAIEVVLSKPFTELPSGGMITRSACGRMTRRKACRRLRPSARAASR